MCQYSYWGLHFRLCPCDAKSWPVVAARSFPRALKGTFDVKCQPSHVTAQFVFQYIEFLALHKRRRVVWAVGAYWSLAVFVFRMTPWYLGDPCRVFSCPT